MNSCQTLNETEVVLDRVARKLKVGVMEKSLADLVSPGGDQGKCQPWWRLGQGSGSHLDGRMRAVHQTEVSEFNIVTLT